MQTQARSELTLLFRFKIGYIIFNILSTLIKIS